MNRAVRRKLEKQGYSKATIMKQYGNEAWEAGFKAGFTEANDYNAIKGEIQNKYGVNLL